MEKEYHNFIYDEEQVRRFVRLLSPLALDEAYFLSMSARNKYLTQEEREHYGLGRTEMFARKIVKCSRMPEKREEVFLRVLRSMQVSHGGYTSKKDIPIPDKCMVVYANINPISGRKALKLFLERAVDVMFDARGDEYTMAGMSNLDTLMMNCYQKSQGKKSLIDVDFDIPKIEGRGIVGEFIGLMGTNGMKFHVVETKSGYHILLEKDTITFNYNVIIQRANQKVLERFGEKFEIVLNKNNMIPVPGTLQAGHEVRFVDDLKVFEEN